MELRIVEAKMLIFFILLLTWEGRGCLLYSLVGNRTKMRIFVTFLFFLTHSSLWEEEGALIWSLRSMEPSSLVPIFEIDLQPWNVDNTGPYPLPLALSWYLPAGIAHKRACVWVAKSGLCCSKASLVLEIRSQNKSLVSTCALSSSLLAMEPRYFGCLLFRNHCREGMKALSSWKVHNEVKTLWG